MSTSKIPALIAGIFNNYFPATDISLTRTDGEPYAVVLTGIENSRLSATFSIFFNNS